MTKEQTVEAIISGFTSTILREHFGKGPSSVYVTVYKSFVCIELRDFLAPMEKVLVDQQQWNRVIETRDLMMMDIRDDFKQAFSEKSGLDVTNLYVDWNLKERSGVILFVLSSPIDMDIRWPDYANRQAMHAEVIRLSIAAQKEPKTTDFFWLSDRTLLIKRTGILTLIELALIKNGFSETLKLAKRPLEHSMFRYSEIPSILKRQISAIFVDWDFEEDTGYTILFFEK